MRILPVSARDLASRRLCLFETTYNSEVPEELKQVDDETLATTEADLVERFDKLFEEAGDTASSDQLADLKAMRNDIQRIRKEQAGRADAVAKRREEMEGLRNDVGGAENEDDDESGDEGEDDTSSEDDGDEGAEGDAEGAEGQERELITAAGGRPAARPSLGVARRTTKPPVKRNAAPAARLALVASAGANGFQAGDKVSLLDAAKIFQTRARSLAGLQGSISRHMEHVASIQMSLPENLTASGKSAEEQALVLDFAADESRLPGNSLVAAGGWCAPSETDYTVANDGASDDGLLDVPNVAVTRGGLRWTRGVDFSSVYGNGFLQTEAQNIAGGDTNKKTCVEVTCGAWDEERLDAIGLCIKAGILQNKAYPESVANFIDESLVAQRHRISASSISRMVADSTAVNGIQLANIILNLLTNIELQIEDMKYRRRVTRAESYEVVLPYWVHTVLRHEYAKLNNGSADPFAKADQQIDAWFTLRNARPQWVYDWQDGLTVAAGNHLPGSNSVTALPSTVKVLIYRAGTWVRGLEDVITINALYDSELLANNEFVANFIEQGLLMAKKGFDSRVLTVALATS